LETFKKGSETGPEASEAFNNLGVSFLYLKRYAEANDIFEHLILLDPRHASAYNNLGKAYSDQGDNERAINYFQRAIEIAPKSRYLISTSPGFTSIRSAMKMQSKLASERWL
jgi:tetratricopeptide (TPR) repeat protein